MAVHGVLWISGSGQRVACCPVFVEGGEPLSPKHRVEDNDVIGVQADLLGQQRAGEDAEDLVRARGAHHHLVHTIPI